MVWEATIELVDGLIERINLLGEQKQVHFAVHGVVDTERFESFSILFVTNRTFHGFIFVRQDLLLNFLDLLFSLLDLVLVLVFYFQKLFIQHLGLLGALER